MALKRKITKEEFVALKKDVQGEYTVDGDHYILDLDGYEDPEELRRARDRETVKSKDLRKRLKETEERLAKLAEPDGDDSDDDVGLSRKERDKKADIAKLEKSWKDKHDKTVSDLAKKQQTAQSYIQKTLITGTADKIAHKISTSPKVMAKFIIDRFRVEFNDDDEPMLQVLDKEGKPGLTVEQLEKELLTDKDLAHMLVGSKASGGGAPRNGADQKLGSGAVASEKSVDWSKASHKDLAAYIKAGKEA